jgi:hypothetical protein
MSKTPFELRYDLLLLAQSILDRKIDIINQQRQQNQKLVVIELAMAPTTEDIIQEAEKLNKFVSGDPKAHIDLSR